MIFQEIDVFSSIQESQVFQGVETYIGLVLCGFVDLSIIIENIKFILFLMLYCQCYVLQFECTNVCFWYIPPSLRGQPETEEWKQKLHKVTSAV